MEFNSAQEFANYIKTELYEYAAEPEDLEIRHAALRERYAEQIAETGIDVVHDFTPLNSSYSKVIEGIVTEIYATLRPAVREQFAKRFHFATIDNRVLNASIKRSKDGRFYGVFVYSALITVLHRLGKLELAYLFPDMVHSCSRFPGEPATRLKMIEIYAEVFTYFTMTKMPHGPQVLLKEPLNSQHLLKLHIRNCLSSIMKLRTF